MKFKVNRYAILASSLLPMAVSASDKTTPNPNVVCILVDDLGYGDLSCQLSATDISTPNIDNLLNNGVRFTNFYANSNVSSPSRASLLTGCYPDRVGMPGVVRSNATIKPSLPTMTLQEVKDSHLDVSWGKLAKEAILLPQVLKQKNYHTAVIGKWHLGLESPDTPLDRGFDFFHGFLGDMMDDYYTHLRWGENYMKKNNEVVDSGGKHATEVFSDWAIDYFNERNSSNVPFFLYLAYNAPHNPVQPPTEWFEKVKNREKNISNQRAALVALIEHMDSQIGRVVDALDKNGQLENTVIIFASDNGGDTDANNGLYRGMKGNMYEGGIRVAGGFYWKDKIQPAVTDNFGIISDIFPTICELANCNISHPIDGISLVPTLMGQKQETDERIVFWVRREGWEFGGRAFYAAKYKNHKLLQNTPFEELKGFDLAADPYEQFPVAKNSKDIYQKLFFDLMNHIRTAGNIPWQ